MNPENTTNWERKTIGSIRIRGQSWVIVGMNANGRARLLEIRKIVNGAVSNTGVTFDIRDGAEQSLDDLEVALRALRSTATKCGLTG